MCARLVSASLILTVATSPSAGAEPLTPIKPWNVDYGEAQCLAMREYGKADDPQTLAIRPAPNGETYELIVVRKRSGPTFAEILKGTVEFGWDAPVKAWLLHYGVKGTKADFYQFRISAAEMDRSRTARSVTLNPGDRPKISFSLENMQALLKSLDECTADLKRYWNMDAKDGAVAIPSKGDIRTVFTDEDYPSEALGRNQEGAAQFLLLIDEKGKVAGCHVAKPSGVPALDGMGCQVIRERAKFRPALDRQGKPVRSSVITPPVTWRLWG